MSTMFEISERYRRLFEMFDNAEELEEDEVQAYIDTLESIEGEAKEKIANTGCYIKHLNADISSIDTIIKQYQTRKKRLENIVKSLKTMMLNTMVETGIKKVSEPIASVSIRNNAESVAIENEKNLIEWLEAFHADFLKYSEPEISKTAVKKALSDGEDIPYAHLQKTQSLIIK